MNESNTNSNYWEDRVKGCLVAAGRYSAALDVNIFILASALGRYVRLNNEMEDETCMLTSPNGACQQHPIMKLIISTEDVILKQMKLIGLSSDVTTTSVDADPLMDLFGDVRNAVISKKK